MLLADPYGWTNLPQIGRKYIRREQYYGLQYIMGWQTDRIRADAPKAAACVYMTVTIIWLCVLLLGGLRMDWGTALAFGQLIAASIALLIVYV